MIKLYAHINIFIFSTISVKSFKKVLKVSREHLLYCFLNQNKCSYYCFVYHSVQNENISIAFLYQCLDVSTSFNLYCLSRFDRGIVDGLPKVKFCPFFVS